MNKETRGLDGLIASKKGPAPAAGKAGTVGVSAHIEEARYLKLRAMATAQRRTNSELISEALDMLFAANGY